MSKGSKIVPVRIPRTMLKEVEIAIATANCFRRDEPYDMGKWIRKCIAEKLNHLKRSRRKEGHRPRGGDEMNATSIEHASHNQPIVAAIESDSSEYDAKPTN